MKPCWWDDPDFTQCTIDRTTNADTWDELFMDIAKLISEMSKCSSRKIGAIIVRDRQILSMGFNGSPVHSSLCQDAGVCPRKKLGYKSGEGIELCPAQHAESNTVNNAAKNGISIKGATIYCYCGMPCQRCAGALINAGIKKVVCLDDDEYDTLAKRLFVEAGVTIQYIY